MFSVSGDGEKMNEFRQMFAKVKNKWRFEPVSDYMKDKSIDAIWDFLDIEKSKCCFCDTETGVLIRLHQGWCCVKCFKEILGEVGR